MTTQTLTPTDFLLARIAEDEAVARTVRPHEHLSRRDSPTLKLGERGGYVTVSTSSGRVLAECEAKRRIVEEWQTFSKVADRGSEASSLPEALTQRGIVVGLERAIRNLALPYADHPDYREEWKP